MIVTKQEDLSGPLSTKGEKEEGHWKWTESAFETIFLQNYERVVAVLVRLVGNHAQAEELADDVFWKLYRQPFPTDREHNVGGWLYRTATRLGIDALRTAVRRKRYERDAERNVRKPDTSNDPLDQALSAEKRRQVRAILAQLKPAHAQLLILRNTGLAYKELAEALGVRPSSIGTLLARAEAEFEKRYHALHRKKE